MNTKNKKNKRLFDQYPRSVSTTAWWKPERFGKIVSEVNEKTRELEKDPSIIAVSIGPSFDDKADLDFPVVRVYPKHGASVSCIRKILPSEIAGCRLEIGSLRVLPSGCPKMDNSYANPLCPGANIGDNDNCGTLGMKVWDTKWTGGPDAPQPEYFITSYHVVPWLGSDIYQPGSPTPGDATAIGNVVKTKGYDTTDGYYEVSLVMINGTRDLIPDPHVPMYPYEPSLWEYLYVKGAGQMKMGGDNTNTGIGVYGELYVYIELPITPLNIVPMRYQMLVLPDYPDDILGAEGNSGAVFYDSEGVPVGITVARCDWKHYLGSVYRGAIVSPLNLCSFDNTDVLADLDVTNIPPEPDSVPTTW